MRTSAGRTDGRPGRPRQPTRSRYAGSRHGAERSGSVGPNSATTGVGGRRGDMQRSGIPADEQPAPRRRAREAPRDRNHRSPPRVRAGCGPSASRALRAIRSAADRSDGPELRTRRRVRDGGQAGNECGRRPPPANAGTGSPRSRGRQSNRDRRRRRQTASRAATRRSAAGVRPPSRRRHVPGRVRRPDPALDRLQQVPLVDDGVARPELARTRRPLLVYIQPRPGFS